MLKFFLIGFSPGKYFMEIDNNQLLTLFKIKFAKQLALKKY